MNISLFTALYSKNNQEPEEVNQSEETKIPEEIKEITTKAKEDAKIAKAAVSVFDFVIFLILAVVFFLIFF